MPDLLLTKCAGAYNIGFGIFHIYFAKLFHWETALTKLDPVNRGILQVVNLMLALVFVLVGAALMLGAGGPRAVNLLLFGGMIFWTVRAALQPLYWSLRPTFAKVMLAIFILGIGLHALPWFQS